MAIRRTFVPVLAILLCGVAPSLAEESVGRSARGPDDEIGTLGRMTEASRASVLARIAGGRIYDLSVEYFVGMPSYAAAGDPLYRYWLTHTPRGTIVDDPMDLPAEQNRKVSYTGDAFLMYTHTGTHVDALNHFGLHGRIWNGFSAAEHLGDRGWRRAGAETIPPIVARGVLIDVAGAQEVEVLPDSFGIGSSALEAALERQGTELRPDDVVLIRTGRMTLWPDPEAYMPDEPGLTLEGARWLVEEKRAMALGADNLSLEVFPPESEGNWVPVHTYLLAEKGVPFFEVMNLEELAEDRVYEFAFVAAPLRLRGASGSPLRPLAFPIRGAREPVAAGGSAGPRRARASESRVD